MVKVNGVKRAGKSDSNKKNRKSPLILLRAEARLKKKKEEVLKVKAQHKKLAGEFIDLWVKVSRIKKKLKLI